MRTVTAQIQSNVSDIKSCAKQGVGDVWTDPQVHTFDGNGYGKGNMGMRGIHAFLQNHRCNAICTALKLPVVVSRNYSRPLQSFARERLRAEEHPREQQT